MSLCTCFNLIIHHTHICIFCKVKCVFAFDNFPNRKLSILTIVEAMFMSDDLKIKSRWLTYYMDHRKVLESRVDVCKLPIVACIRCHRKSHQTHKLVRILRGRQDIRSEQNWIVRHRWPQTDIHGRCRVPFHHRRLYMLFQL